MEAEGLTVAQIVHLFRQRPHVVWDLLPPSMPARDNDIALRDREGKVVGYARPVAGEPRLPRY